MSDYTPTTDQVRDAYVKFMRNAFIASASEHAAEFDRWLSTQYDRGYSDGFMTGLRMLWKRQRRGSPLSRNC